MRAAAFGFIGLLSLLAAFASPAKADRYALVIGNADYERGEELSKTHNDALDMAQALQDTGFSLIGGGALLDQTRSQMLRGLQELERAASPGDTALVYFAGHGIGGTQTNYLIPVDDIDILSRRDLPDFAVDLRAILSRLSARGDGVNIILLDACRDVPTQYSSLSDTARSSDTARGLASVTVPIQTFIFYAAAPGQKAYESPGRNGYFTEALLDQIREPGVELYDLTRRVVAEVYSATGHHPTPQQPHQEGTVFDYFYFNSSGTATELTGSRSLRSAIDAGALSTANAEVILSAVLSRFEFAEVEALALEGDPTAMFIAATAYERSEANIGSCTTCLVLPEYLDRVNFTLAPQAYADYARRACALGDNRACTVYGNYHYLGLAGLVTSPELAADHYRRACQAGTLMACNNLALAIEAGLAEPLGDEVALELYQRACEDGVAGSCGNLGYIHYTPERATGIGAAHDPGLAFDYWLRACEGGDVRSCGALGHSLFTGGRGVERNIPQALAYLEEGCDGGALQSCLTLGFAFQHERGGPDDLARAVEFYRRSCDHNSPEGCRLLALAYREGLGDLGADPGRAIELLDQSCELGDATGCSHLAFAYWHGSNVRQNRATAREIYGRACELGDADACNYARTR